MDNSDIYININQNGDINQIGGINQTGGMNFVRNAFSTYFFNCENKDIMNYLNIYSDTITFEDCQSIRNVTADVNVAYNKIKRNILYIDASLNKLREIENYTEIIEIIKSNNNYYNEFFNNLCDLVRFFKIYLEKIEITNKKINEFIGKIDKEYETSRELENGEIAVYNTELLDNLKQIGLNKTIPIELQHLLSQLSIIFTFGSNEPIKIYSELEKYAKDQNLNFEEYENIYKKYTDFFNYLQNYSTVELHKYDVFLEIKLNTFNLSDYDFVNKIINPRYSGITVFENLVSITNSQSPNSDFLDKNIILGLIKSQFMTVGEFTQKLLSYETKYDSLSKGTLSIEGQTEIKQKLYLEYPEYVNPNEYNSDQDYHLFVKLGLLTKKIKYDPSRKEYYAKIFKFLSTYNQDLTKDILYPILSNIIDYNNQVALEELKELKKLIKKLDFLYKLMQDQDKKESFDLLTNGNIIQNLKSFTESIDSDEFFNVSKMMKEINRNELIINPYDDSYNIRGMITHYESQIREPKISNYISKIANRYERFVTLYLLLTNKILDAEDTDKNFNLICDYVNAYKNIKLPNREINVEIEKFILNDPKSRLVEYINYNKSLNHKFGYNQDHHTYLRLVTLVKQINAAGYLDTNNMTEKIKTYYQDRGLPIDFLFTDKLFETKDLPTKIYKDECIINNIKNKVLSGIKIFIYIYECIDKQINANPNGEYNRIYIYLIKNSTEKNTKKLIRPTKLIKILQKLKIGNADANDIKILKKLHSQKKVKDLDFTSIINLVDEHDAENQIYLYNTLLYLAPENYEIDPVTMLDKYLKIKLPALNMTVSNAYSKIMETYQNIKKINLDDFEEFMNKYLLENIGEYWQFYLYFNFDSRIINKKDLTKIIDNLKNRIYIKKNIITLEKIIQKNKIYLENLSKDLNPKLKYFIVHKWPQMETNPELLNQLYNILNECAKQNLSLLNGLDFIKEIGGQTLRVVDSEEELLDKIVFMFEVFNNNPINKNVIAKLREGDADDSEIGKIVIYINSSADYISANDMIKIFLNKYSDKLLNLEYDNQQELFDILGKLAKTSTLLSDIVNQTIEETKDVLVNATDNYIKLKMLNTGITIPEGNILNESNRKELIKFGESNIDSIVKEQLTKNSLPVPTGSIFDIATDTGYQQELTDLTRTRIDSIVKEQLTKYGLPVPTGSIFDIATDTGYQEKIVNTAVEKVDTIMEDKGYGYIAPSKLIKTATNTYQTLSTITNIAKPLIATIGIAYATKYVYNKIDQIFGLNTPNTNTQEYGFLLEEYNKYKKHIFVMVSTGLSIYAVQNDLIELAKKYIDLNLYKNKLPKILDSILLPTIGSIITGAISFYVKTQSGGSSDLISINSESLLEKIINFILEQIDKIFGFNNKNPEQSINSDLVKPNKSKQTFETLYVHLKDRLPNDLSDIFSNVELNEHPNQKEILELLKKRYSEFSSLTSNSYLNLSKKDIKNIKKIIAQIVSLEINLFKETDQYTFVKAFKDFMN
jgi:hypothetical protein